MMTLNEIIGFMPAPLAAEIMDDVFADDKPLYRAISAEVAAALKLRPIFFERKARADRDKVILDMLTRPRMLGTAATLLRGWLLKSEADMLADFLDTLGIPHKKGAVESFPKEVDDAKLGEAIEKLLAKYSREKVAVYLGSFNVMNDAAWPSLTKRLQEDTRLHLI